MFHELSTFRNARSSSSPEHPLLPKSAKDRETTKDCSCCYQKCTVIIVLIAMALTFLTFALIAEFGKIRRGSQPGAVASNGETCAEIASGILRQGGSAVDAAIATMLCESVLLPQSTGAGGGFMATIYTKGKVETLMAREMAPRAAHQDMFIDTNVTGVMATGVPGQLWGYWRLHQKYGKLPWRKLFEASIELCTKGFRVTRYLANILKTNERRLCQEPTMKEIFYNPHTNSWYKEGETMLRPKLADTLKIIAAEGAEVMYRGGRVGKWLIADIQEMGGIIKEEDLLNYEVRWEAPLVVNFTAGYTLYTTPLPSGGSVLAFILNVMAPLLTTHEDVYWQRLLETFKHAYGHRSNLGDVHYEPTVSEEYKKLLSPEFIAKIRRRITDNCTFTDMNYYGAHFANVADYGTAHICVVAPNGNAVSLTSTINSHLGAKVRSRRTGFILNDEMDDFSTPGTRNAFGIPASPFNFIKPGKRPMSSACPSLIFDRVGKLRLVIGAAGGPRIPTALAQTILRYLILGESMERAVSAGRFHHQLAPMFVDVEQELPAHIEHYFENSGHVVKHLPGDKGLSAVTAIGLKTKEPHPVSDRRRLGSTAIILL